MRLLVTHLLRELNQLGNDLGGCESPIRVAVDCLFELFGEFARLDKIRSSNGLNLVVDETAQQAHL